MQTKQPSEKLSELQSEVDALTELCNILNQELRMYRVILSDKNRIIDKLAKEINKANALSNMAVKELVNKKQNLREGIAAVNLLIQRLSYEQAMNQNYLKQIIEGVKETEITFAKRWLDSLDKKEVLN